MLKLTKEYYRAKGTGRPTKKDRRDLEDYVSDEDFMEKLNKEYWENRYKKEETGWAIGSISPNQNLY